MKKILIAILLGLLAFVATAQKSSYIKERFSFTAAYEGYFNISEYPSIDQLDHGFSLKANYGVAKFWEPGLMYYFTKSYSRTVNDVGVTNRLHLLPFFVNSDSKFFRLDTYIVNNYYVSFATSKNLAIVNDNNEIILLPPQKKVDCITDVGIGASFFFIKNVGLNLEYRFRFYLNDPSFYCHNFNIGVIVKF